MQLRLYNSKKRCLNLILLSIFFYCFLFCLTQVVPADEVNENELYSKSAVLMDGKTGRVLYSKNGEEDMAMASTTKVMTCIIALENASLDKIIEVTDYAAKMPEVSLGMKAGEKYRLEDLLYSLMLESHNDTAVAIAEGVAGSVEKFCNMMNNKAYEIGCLDTCFITPNGLDETDSYGNYHHTTAKELALIMSYCINTSSKREEFLTITRTESYSFSDIDGKRQYVCNNHNSFLGMMEGALSGKTGFTNKAGYCYVGALRRDNKDMVVALLACGWPNNKNYKWKDTRLLLNYGLDNYNLNQIRVPYETVKLKVENGQYDTLNEECSIAIADVEISEEEFLMSSEDVPKVKYEIMEYIEAPVAEGEKIGEIIYLINDYEIYNGDICITSEIKAKNMLWAVKELIEFVFK